MLSTERDSKRVREDGWRGRRLSESGYGQVRGISEKKN